MYIGLHIKYPILMKLEFSRMIFENYSNIKYNENPSRGSRVVACGWTGGRTDGQTGMTKLIVAFYNFSNLSKNRNKLFFFENCAA
jgi:hypothetical protein